MSVHALFNFLGDGRSGNRAGCRCQGVGHLHQADGLSGLLSKIDRGLTAHIAAAQDGNLLADVLYRFADPRVRTVARS